ncbi:MULTISPECIES: DUF2909 domain-containing protein [unclassified Arsukibacterium]|uniref:DUF2909 domain-containing protein n=1 Tax=unclassified Arsukibacterium TaxID=2635278 RepID=UPI000C681EFC|nr:MULTISPECIES: DUF2909 domain-containing protein [unclassified Arsukibacterium]MAA94834.1 hypothetical protein [Rheinheimera sp.]MBM34709.1 hypothetical protein [Rheinheimera sp.]HAW93015.1 DUF2909 domain-containing protein [Candidatus Azambacteria bacterium]|tara:strand:- start:43448 stop:43657 length:210 start_codon:yes stop_codon:yes gene_type:complete
MLLKLVIIALLLFIVFNLFRAGLVMLRNDPEQKQMSRFLGRRVFLSVLVLLVILLAMALGWITPNPRPY